MNNLRERQTRKQKEIALIEKHRRSQHTQGHSDTIEAISSGGHNTHRDTQTQKKPSAVEVTTHTGTPRQYS